MLYPRMMKDGQPQERFWRGGVYNMTKSGMRLSRSEGTHAG